MLSADAEKNSQALKINQFDFHLPNELIAQQPARERGESRLLVASNGQEGFHELRFSQLKQLLRSGDLLICNDSRVIPARLEARKPTGGRVEILVERMTDEFHIVAHLNASRPVKVGDSIVVSEKYTFTVVDRKRNLFVLRLKKSANLQAMMETFGSVPLPPYIKRSAKREDYRRYQTVYARQKGSVAAPTAGLHFSKSLMQNLREAGVEIEFITLHVGAGTFAPIRDGDISNHHLHSERCTLSKSVCDAVERTRRRGKRIIAVGTTTVRVLEAVARAGPLKPFVGETDLFIKPGFQFKVVDGLITNFHLPRSTLLMLVCAFGGRERMLSAYHHAVKQEFRFYSYGDAMFIERRPIR